MPTFDTGFALLVGIQYLNSNSSLACTKADVEAVHSILTNPTKSAYPENQVKLLLEEKATAENILDALDWIENAANSDSTIIVYFSGHGGCDEGKFYFEPYDFKLPLLGSNKINWNKAKVVSSEKFAEKIRAIRAKSKKVLVVLDCCHAAGSSSVKGGRVVRNSPDFLGDMQGRLSDIEKPKETKNLNTSALSEGEGLVILSSCKPTETSLTGNPLSLFTKSLINVLGGAGKSESDDGWIYIEDIKRYLDTHVPKEASPHPQTPVTDMKGVSGHFRVCAYNIARAKGGIADSTVVREAVVQILVALPSKEEILVAYNAAKYREVIKMMDKLVKPNPGYSTLKRYIQSSLDQGLTPNQALLDGLEMRIDNLEN